MFCHSKFSGNESVQLVASLVAYALVQPLNEILAKGRGRPSASFARHVSMYLCHVGLGMSLSQVARAFDRDRSTVAHGCHLIEDRRDDPDFDDWLEELETSLHSILPLQKTEAA